MHRLSSTLNLQDVPKDVMKGTIRITRIDIPIIKELVKAHAANLDTKDSHNKWFFCVIGYGENVYSTQCLPLSAAYKSGYLAFKSLNDIIISDVSPDFQIKVEIFGLSLDTHVDPKKHGFIDMLTPGKKASKKGFMMQSPAGPHAVREPQFKSKGSVILTAKNLKKKCHTIQNFHYESTIDGQAEIQVTMKPEYSLSYKNFLHFYDGGIWNRRWVRIHEDRLLYWRTPEDEERREAALGQMDMKKCINPVIVPVPTEVCPRKNAFGLIFQDCKSAAAARVNQLLGSRYSAEIQKWVISRKDHD